MAANHNTDKFDPDAITEDDMNGTAEFYSIPVPETLNSPDTTAREWAEKLNPAESSPLKLGEADYITRNSDSQFENKTADEFPSAQR